MKIKHKTLVYKKKMKKKHTQPQHTHTQRQFQIIKKQNNIELKLAKNK